VRITRPRRVTRSYVQTIEGTPEEIMPLYCPVREAEWCAGWDPIVVYSESGLGKSDESLPEDRGTANRSA